MATASKKHWKLKFLACAGIIAACALLAFAVGDENYNATAIGWMPLIAVVSAILFAFIYVRILKAGLSVSAKSMLHDCRRGDDIAFDVHFRNKTPLFFFRVEAYFYVSDLFGQVASEASTTISFAPFEKYDFSFSASFDHIGTYTAGLDKLVVCDFLHLFTAEIEGDRTQTVHVTPRIQSLEHLELSVESDKEAPVPKKSVFADSLDYAYVRPYVPGDPLKTIHWKLSSRTEGYMTRLFEENTNPGVAVVLDFYSTETNSACLMGIFDAVVEVGFSVGDYARAEGLDTEIHYTNRKGEPVMCTSWVSAELDEIIADMPSITNDADKEQDAVSILLGQLRNQFGQNNLVVCTSNLSPDIISTILDAKMRRKNPILFAIAPAHLEGRELEKWKAPLKQLSGANIAYKVLSRSDDLVGGGQ